MAGPLVALDRQVESVMGICPDRGRQSRIVLAFLRPAKEDLAMVVIAVLLAVAILLIPFPAKIGSGYYSAVSAVIPLLLIALLSRLGHFRSGAGGRSGIAEYQAKWESLSADLARDQDTLTELGETLDRDAKASVADLKIVAELANLKRANSRMTSELQTLPSTAGDLVIAHIYAAAVITFITGVGEAATLSQLATNGHSHIAYFLANGTIALLFAGVVYFELVPLLMFREREGKRASEWQQDQCRTADDV